MPGSPTASPEERVEDFRKRLGVVDEAGVGGVARVDRPLAIGAEEVVAAEIVEALHPCRHELVVGGLEGGVVGCARDALSPRASTSARSAGKADG